MQVYLFIVFRVQMISQGVTLLFFFAEKKKRSKKRKKKRVRVPPVLQDSSITRKLYKRFLPTKIPRRGEQAAAAAVTLPFSHLKLGRKVGGDPPLSLLKRKKEAKKEKSSRFTCTTKSSITRRLHRESSTDVKSFV
ncbi:hypothetical protein [uncultured Ruminococcus sp.]|uniref:hypothetical protein n=1 Tax=uncultured Ruminococcus sp. TaxID=165186 RepID=UPI0025958C67|nr:hypothetical protein [uncultured Ruminococcus sp.]